MSNQPTLALLIKLPFDKRCELPECHKPKRNLYKVDLDNDNRALFCSIGHAKVGMDRWQEKVKLGIKPGMPADLSMSQPEEQTGDNIQEYE